MESKELVPYASILLAVLALVTLGVRLMFRGGLVPRVQVDELKIQHTAQIATYERIIEIYKASDATKQNTIDTLTASLDKMAEAQHTTNSLIRGLASAAEANRKLAAREPQT